ncbi:MAG: efflux transporter outer membrane subunit [Janthinobacterium lividum]
MNLRLCLPILCGAALAAGCAVQPATHADLNASVAQTVPADWSASAPESDATLDAWWGRFADPTLQTLIQTVLQHNLDLDAALERIQQAQAASAQADSYLSPTLTATGNAADTRQNAPPPLGYVRTAGAGVAASWNPDVFGGVRLELLAAEARTRGAVEAANELRVALAASTAADYMQLRWAQNDLRILNDNVAIRTRALRLTERRHEFGMATRLDVVRARNQLNEIEARVPAARAAIAHQTTALAVLSGATPESFEIRGGPAVPIVSAVLPTLLPSTAMLRRPDVRRAYTVVEARAAAVGAARAQRYPQFTLRLSDGLLAASYLGLPTLTDNLFSAALGVTSPIFNAGRITASIAGSESGLREAQSQLHQTMLGALKDVEDARTDLLALSEQVAKSDAALDASQQALTLSIQLYRGGASSFLDVLAAQNAYLNDAQALNRARRDDALAAVGLYRALGGGWSDS